MRRRRRRDINGVDLRIGDQLVRVVDTSADAVPPRVILRFRSLRRITARQRRIVRLLKSGAALDLGDVAAADNSPANLLHLYHLPRGFAPRTPLHTLSLAASPARSGRVARSLRSLALDRGLRPSDSPTHSLARRFAGSLRSRGSLAALARADEGLRPSDSPTRSLARRFAGALRSRGSLAALARASA